VAKVSEWIMRYGEPYVIMEVPPITWGNVTKHLDNIITEQAKLFSKDGWEDKSSVRDSLVGWVSEPSILDLFFDMGEEANKACGWNLNIQYLEPLQYTVYHKDGFYDWHVDQHSKVVDREVRKISFTCWVNDEYEGGEFDLEVGNPNDEVRYKTFVREPGKVIFFMSDWFHRVRPIRSGVRKSLVGWFSGPQYV